MRVRLAPLCVLAAAVAAGPACLVQVTHVDDARAAFREAREEALRSQGRGGRARHLNVLVWDPRDRELVRVRLPLWVARKAEGHLDWDETGLGAGRADRARRDLERRFRVEDLERAGPGPLLEVEEDDGEQVLIWLR